MASKAIIALVLTLAFSFPSSADVVKFNSSHPDSYVVVKGDTLWGISARFLRDPWLWPKVWKHNGQIRNPHLIYPGDVISFCFVNGQPMLCVDSASNDERVLYPHMRTSSDDDAIAMIPFEAIAPYLTSPKVVGKDELENSPYIVDFSGEHLVAGAGVDIFRAHNFTTRLSRIYYLSTW